MPRADDALEKALRLIDEKGLQIEDCLAMLAAPEADRLRPLLQTVAAVKERARAAPAPVSQEANKAVFLAELAALRATEATAENHMDQISAPFGRWLRTRLAHTLAAAAAAVVLTGGVATAAGYSGPASPLYPVKRAVEAVETALPRSDYAQAKLRLELAETRLAELERAEDRQDGAYERLYAEFNSELSEVKNLAARLSYAERRQAFNRYMELELRYKNVSHRRLEEIGELEEGAESKSRSEAPSGHVPEGWSNQDDEEKVGDGGSDGGATDGSRPESKSDEKVDDSNDGPSGSDDEAVKKSGSKESDEDSKKADDRRRRRRRDSSRESEERRRSTESGDSGDERDEDKD